jgi:catechol 2,3-dioxygenase-like lactoylglutathione lyase family enzyme
MKLNHLAICARDVAACQDFYCNYFGFRQGPGPGLLASKERFALAIHEVDEVLTLPACVHFGFFLARALKPPSGARGCGGKAW